MGSTWRRTVRVVVGAAAALALVAGAQLALAAPASAASSAAASAQTLPVAEPFTAPQCAGNTEFDPTDVGGPVTDLTQVFGARLTAYNAGAVVPVYDAFGLAQGSYPPLCGVRYDEATQAPVSEWMFCTDITSKVCGDVDADGNLLEQHSGTTTVVNQLDELPTNPRLDANQEKLVAYLVHEGHAYAGIGDQSWGGVTTAASGAGSNERAALQTLIWCVSDPVSDTATSDYAETCRANMDATEKARLLALIPDAPTVTLSFDDSGDVLKAGDTARFALETNLYNQPINVAVVATDGVIVTVCDGNASYADGVLTVPGTDPTIKKTVELCATAAQAGAVSLTASAQPASTTHIGWNQSRDNADGVACQVFATFQERDQLTLISDASATFVVAPTTTPTTPTTSTPTTPTTTPTAPTTLDQPKQPKQPKQPTQPNTAVAAGGKLPSLGANVSPYVIAAAVLFILAGGIVLSIRRGRVGSSD